MQSESEASSPQRGVRRALGCRARARPALAGCEAQTGRYGPGACSLWPADGAPPQRPQPWPGPAKTEVPWEVAMVTKASDTPA